jgi:hypothetical protein
LKYVGLDVHRDTISVVVLGEGGKMMMQTTLATLSGALLDFVGGLRGSVHLNFEEGTHSESGCTICRRGAWWRAVRGRTRC